MSGHSKWAQIKRQKGAADVKRSAVYTKLGHMIALAVRDGGKDAAMNPALRVAFEKAKAANMPNATIERAVQRGTGVLGSGQVLEEVRYEGFGPGGIAIMVDAVTENKNRTAAEVRRLLTKSGGSMGASGSVLWMFAQRGMVTVETLALTEEQELAAIDTGADDLLRTSTGYTVNTKPEAVETVKQYFLQQGMAVPVTEVVFVPHNPVTPETDTQAVALGKLVDALEALDEVSRVTTNAPL